jgi:hypothetical protein
VPVYVRTPRKWISSSVLAGAMLAAAGVGLWRIPAVLAEDAVVIDGQNPLDNAGGGMPGSNPRVQSILAAHPDQFVVLCVAGCGGKESKIVQILPKPMRARTAEFVPSAAGPEDKAKGRKGYFAADEGDDVVCVAGCAGKPGQVVQRNLDLPPPVLVKPKTSDARTPPPAPPAPAPEKSPEPLDIHP